MKSSEIAMQIVQSETQITYTYFNMFPLQFTNNNSNNFTPNDLNLSKHNEKMHICTQNHVSFCLSGILFVMNQFKLSNSSSK